AVLLVLSLLGTALAFALWFSLLHRGELTRLNTFTFLTPVFALTIGYFSFNERLGIFEIGGIALILASVWWISYKPAVKQSFIQSSDPSAPLVPIDVKGEE
ncbi:MAG: DMT family transporter, partial [Caldilineaceae bacterium]